MAVKKITEEELMKELKKHEEFITAARTQLSERVPYWEKELADAEARVAGAKRMLVLLRGVPTAAKAPGVPRGKGVREEFEKWFDALPHGATVSLKQMSDETGIPRGTIWGIKEALIEEGLISEVSRGVYKKE